MYNFKEIEEEILEFWDKKKIFENFVKTIKKSLYRGIAIFNETKNIEEHYSTKDRNYECYKKIFSKIKNVKKIVDLGSGLNPLAYNKLNFKPEYIAYEINNEYVKQINKYFIKNNIKGQAYCKDIFDIKQFQQADVYFLFKLLESVEQKKRT